MKRRNFVQNLLAAPAAPALLAAQAVSPPGSQQQPVPPANTPARQFSRQPQNVPSLTVTAAELTAEGDQRFFSPVQFATLRQLGAVMVPPIKNSPGAVDAGAAEFLDFLISVSPAERQESYRRGLDAIDGRAKERYQKAFADLAPAEAGAILRPLMTVRYWPEDLPTEPLESFVAQVHEDLRRATMNSREYVAVAEKTHRFTQRARSSGMYWAPIDPVVEG